VLQSNAYFVITAAGFGRVRVLKIVGLGQRRGPVNEAQALYVDFTPAEAWIDEICG
jgi:hypothetical protein